MREIQDVEYIGSFPRFRDLPDGELPEICFWGRSNVGKSSLINLICNRKEMARVSTRPGKTQSFNQYLVDGSWFIMDLPGYGYAQVGKKLKSHWGFEIPKYLKGRRNLCLLLLLVDASIEPQAIDIQTMQTLGEWSVPFYIVLTKVDKCTKAQKKEFVHKLSSILHNDWEQLPEMHEISAVTREGKEELLFNINKLVKELGALKKG